MIYNTHPESLPEMARVVRMSSPYEDFDKCRSGWPIRPGCDHLIGFGIYTALAILNLMLACMPRGVSYRRVGNLPVNFFVAIICKFILIAVSISFIFYSFYVHKYSHTLMAFSIARVIHLKCQFVFYMMDFVPTILIRVGSTMCLIRLLRSENRQCSKNMVEFLTKDYLDSTICLAKEKLVPTVAPTERGSHICLSFSRWHLLGKPVLFFESWTEVPAQ
ncbi:hypothetical protein COOONC_16227 [Cooperia oncophora]